MLDFPLFSQSKLLLLLNQHSCSTGTGCGNPGVFENGVFAPNKESYTLWERIEFTCNPGYELDGKEWRICNEKNQFDSLPVCRPITCPVPMAPDYGSVSPQQKDYFYNTVITYSCNDGYILEGAASATCLQSGVFSESTPTCKGKKILIYSIPLHYFYVII